MENKRQYLHPGDRVRLTKDVFDIGSAALDPDKIILLGTKGSIGMVVSFDEYRADYEQSLKQHHITNLMNYEDLFSRVRKAIENGIEYPIRFEKTLQSETSVDLVVGREGKIVLIFAPKLEKIE